MDYLNNLVEVSRRYLSKTLPIFGLASALSRKSCLFSGGSVSPSPVYSQHSTSKTTPATSRLLFWFSRYSRRCLQGVGKIYLALNFVCILTYLHLPTDENVSQNQLCEFLLYDNRDNRPKNRRRHHELVLHISIRIYNMDLKGHPSQQMP